MENWNDEEIDRVMQIVHDTKKTIGYDKSTGEWYWHDRDEADNIEAHHTGFPTFMAAAHDAVEPYLEESE